MGAVNFRSVEAVHDGVGEEEVDQYGEGQGED